MNVSLHGCIGASPHWLTVLFSPLEYFVCVLSWRLSGVNKKKKERKKGKKKIFFCQSEFVVDVLFLKPQGYSVIRHVII